MFTLVAVVLVSIGVSSLCSLMEAALFSVPLPHVRHLSEGEARKGGVLLEFKSNMARPIGAILILNTVSNTLGAAFAGALVLELYGEEAVVLFSILFTIAILLLSEIVPKQIGSVYAKPVSAAIAVPLFVLLKVLWPLVRMCEIISAFIGSKSNGPSVSTSEVLSMAEIGREEGVLDHLEGSVIRNVVGLDRVLVKDILTPRVVVFRLAESVKLEELRADLMGWNHTRVPLFSEDNPDSVSRYVIQRDIFRAFLKEETDSDVRSLSRPLTTVYAFMRADKLLLQMFEMRETICSVVDEHGGFAGIVTLEDIIEEIVGREIVDEYDAVSDLRSYAQILHAKSKRAEGEVE
jgi:CBS domain containing-hemolysin-like protein